MTTMSVPSTLVKCLYLFFDLPHVPEAGGGTQSELPLAERRGLLQKAFVQVRALTARVHACFWNCLESEREHVLSDLLHLVLCVLIRVSLCRLG